VVPESADSLSLPGSNDPRARTVELDRLLYIPHPKGRKFPFFLIFVITMELLTDVSEESQSQILPNSCLPHLFGPTSN
jgi:hypothetical protein